MELHDLKDDAACADVRTRLTHLQGLRNTRNHLVSFHKKIGYIDLGYIPNANSFGKPAILMAKQPDEYSYT